MPRCGDCKEFMPNVLNTASSMGVCKGILDDDGMGKEVDMYADIDSCVMYVEHDSIRTNVSEFMSIQNMRMAKGFDEK